MDCTDLEAAIRDAETSNRMARENRAYNQIVDQWEAEANKSEELTARIQAIDQEKADRLAAAEFPVPGLSFDGDTVTLDGLPFQQASSSEQLKVSMAICAKMNPRLKLCRIKDGALLDESKLALLHSMAEQLGVQVLMEVVGEGDATIVIEDGTVKGAKAQTAAVAQPGLVDLFGED